MRRKNFTSKSSGAVEAVIESVVGDPTMVGKLLKKIVKRGRIHWMILRFLFLFLFIGNIIIIISIIIESLDSFTKDAFSWLRTRR